ncbi:MAG: excisionase family DNA-binding protein [Frankiaceae bacterium]|nr:excisionase family DNA-binding protein [Frankiaceae bacterium]
MYRVPEAAELLGIGRSKLFELMAAGQIESVKVGRSRLIPAAALDKFVARLCGDPAA